MTYQGAANRVVRGLLRVPLLANLMGSRLVVLYLVGRKTGRRYSIPVAYIRHDGTLLIGSPFGWGRNLRTGEPVDIRLKGRRRPADVEVIADEAGVVELYGAIARENRAFANFNKIAIHPDGRPDQEQLHRLWLAGARVFRLTPR